VTVANVLSENVKHAKRFMNIDPVGLVESFVLQNVITSLKRLRRSFAWFVERKLFVETAERYALQNVPKFITARK